MGAPGPVVVNLEWQAGEGLRFRGEIEGGVPLVLDSGGLAGPSPVQAVAAALAGCMAIDVVNILERGRQPVRTVRAALVAPRAPDDPKRIVSVDLRFTVSGNVPAEKVERAIALSREKYCSVWHTLRQDIEFKTSFEVRE